MHYGFPIDYANDLVCEQVDGATEPKYISTVRWRSDWRCIGTYARQFESVRAGNGAREAISGL